MNKSHHFLIENILLKFPKFSKRLQNYLIRNEFGQFINLLYKKKINIKNVYDIGAHHGDWSNFYRKTSLKRCNFFLFEANKANKEIIEKKNFKVFIDILSDKKKVVNFYNNNNSSGDSYYIENTKNHQRLSPTKIKATTLNHLVKKNYLPMPDLIKIDTQGSELDILKGSSKVLKNCKILYLECPISSKFNLNGKNILDYIKYLHSLDFLPHLIHQNLFYQNYLVQADIMFIRKNLFSKIGLSPKLLKNLF